MGNAEFKNPPSPYPLPRGERVNILKYKEEFPPPLRGRARVGVIIQAENESKSPISWHLV
jgi:hypothetical protein